MIDNYINEKSRSGSVVGDQDDCEGLKEKGRQAFHSLERSLSNK